ncbi:Rieske 2Fe-2S domain-containing protein [Pedobacter sp. P351]|uniref:Rieske 2Fe-2S domain-containing protein n=1 Tax=Pedobacter superstes TaxID=3133441 RepID=UPI003099B962
MERDEFLKSLGIGLAMVCTGTCLQSCGKGGSDDTGTPGNPPGGGGGGGGGNTASVDISSMTAVGSQNTVNGVLFIRMDAANAASSFVATEAVCPHEQGVLTWQHNNSRIICGNHQSTYSSTGAVTGQPVGGGTTRALKIYTVSLTGTTLTATKT